MILTRQALYDLVWKEPVRTVAEGFGLSDVGLRKICQHADIPLPERGYWTRHKVGKAPLPLKLPPRGIAMPHTVRIGAAPSYLAFWPHTVENLEAELSQPLSEPPLFKEAIEALTQRVAKRVGRVRFERNLNDAHPLVRALLDKDDARRLQRGDSSWRSTYEKPLFDSGFERHRLRLLNSIFLGLQKSGARPSMRGNTGRDMSVSVGIETVNFTLDHPNAKADRFGEWKTWPGTIDVQKLSVTGAGARVWIDTEEDRLEAHLDEVVVHLIVSAEMNYRASAVGTFQRAMKRREEAAVELEKARLEAQRKAREVRRAAEARRREVLIGMAADLRAAEDIRALVRHVADTHQEAVREPALLWGRWALEVAERLDPTSRLRFSEGGIARAAEPDWPDTDVLSRAANETEEGDGDV
jgi:hypothetical protein